MGEREVRIPYTPRYPEVHDVLERTRFVVLVAHRRFGKTVLVVNHLLKMALLCRREHGLFAYVGPFRSHTKDLAWRYFKKYAAPLPGIRIHESELAITLPNGAQMRIFGADNPDALRGLYFDGVVLDEVADMKAPVWEEVIRPALADRRGWAVFIGTPKGINLFSALYYGALEKRKKGSQDWDAMSYPITRTGERSLSAEEVAAMKEDMSENKFRQELLCDFAASTDNVLITLDEVDAAMRRPADPEAVAPWPLVIGVDVARFGDDATVFFRRRGLMACEPEIMRNLANTEVAHRLMACINEYHPTYVCIDQGQGTGVIDLVRELTRTSDTTVIEVPFGSRASRPARFVNRRAEMWTAIRDWLRSGGRLPLSEALRAELTTPTYDYDAAGRIRLEAKELVKERLHRSTDLADALALTFAVPVGPADFAPGKPYERRRPQRQHPGRKPYNPFADSFKPQGNF